MNTTTDTPTSESITQVLLAAGKTTPEFMATLAAHGIKNIRDGSDRTSTCPISQYLNLMFPGAKFRTGFTRTAPSNSDIWTSLPPVACEARHLYDSSTTTRSNLT